MLKIFIKKYPVMIDNIPFRKFKFRNVSLNQIRIQRVQFNQQHSNYKQYKHGAGVGHLIKLLGIKIKYSFGTDYPHSNTDKRINKINSYNESIKKQESIIETIQQISKNSKQLCTEQAVSNPPTKRNTQIKSYKCYYDWNDQNSYQKALKQCYFLDDILQGFRVLISKKIQYSQKHLQFMAYCACLFPEHEDQIMRQFIPNFIKNQQKPDYHLGTPSYMNLAKTFCVQRKQKQGRQKKQYTQVIQKYLRKRINHPQNRNSLQNILKSTNNNCFQSMGNLSDVFEDFKKLAYTQFVSSNYGLSNEMVRTIVSVYQNLSIFDRQIKFRPFFSTLPTIYQQNEKTFQNFVQILPELLTFNFVNYTSNSDIENLNLQIAKCTKFKSKRSRVLLRRYSEHLLMINRVQLINFSDLLDSI